MRKWKKLRMIVLSCLLAAACALSGCAPAPAYVTSIVKTGENGLQDIYTVTYSDGTNSVFTVTNGKDGDVSVADMYEEYVARTGDDIGYEEFLEKFLTLDTDHTAVTGEILSASAKVYAEAAETTTGMFGQSVSKVSIYTGSAVIYAIDDTADGYTYLVTNYHVVYSRNANAHNDGWSHVARKIYCYLYGSEGAPQPTNVKDAHGYTVYDYGAYGIPCEFVGGSIETDIAVLRAETRDLMAINAGIRAAEPAENCCVGQTAVTVGNPEDKGMSVTKGIVSTEGEYINLKIDDTVRSYRSLRIDTPLYGGNSGGGLFDADGKLIGITNAGNEVEQNINYAIPLDIVRGAVENILYYDRIDRLPESGIYKLVFGFTARSEQAKYVYDPHTGIGAIEEKIYVDSVEKQSIAARMGLRAGDRLVSLQVNGVSHGLKRSYAISDLSMTIRPEDSVTFCAERDGQLADTAEYTVAFDDLTVMA